MKFPDRPEALTTEWLTYALNAGSLVENVRVSTFEIELFGAEQSGTGELARLDLVYANGRESAPQSIIAKFASPDSGIRADNHAFGLYEREVRFYQELADQVELRTPRCYYSDIDLETGSCILLFEDLAPIRSIDKFATCTLAEAELVIKQIARFHATWWQHPKLGEMEWLSYANPAFYQEFQVRYQKSWEPFLESVGSTLPDEILTLGEKLTQHGLTFWQLLQESPQTIIHFDYHLGNLLFMGDPENEIALSVVDWQLVRTGRGVYDVSLFMGRNVESHDRKAKEMSFLKMYHTILTENGIKNYSFDQCLHDYRLFALSNLLRSVLFMGGGINDPNIEAYKAALPRCSSAILDLNVAELLLKWEL